MKKVVSVDEAVGMALAHDLTRIVPGESKGRAFRKGHVIKDEDVDQLLQIGKQHIYVFDLREGLVHEDDAARRIAAAAAGDNTTLTQPCEGRVNLVAEAPGLLSIDVERLHVLNAIPDVTFATLHSGQFVPEGRAVGGTRVVPLVVEEQTVARAEAVCRSGGPLVRVKPLKTARVGVVTTGSEVHSGRIEDRFGPVLESKFRELGSTILDQILVSDDLDMTVRAIHDLKDRGADMIVCTGGMSVDPDDQTPASIRAAGAEVVSYGAPVFPGAMFLLAWLNEVPVLGLPGCVMYYKASIFDLVVPRLLAGEAVTREDITRMGHGGFCSGCVDCRFPACSFGKGA